MTKQKGDVLKCFFCNPWRSKHWRFALPQLDLQPKKKLWFTKRPWKSTVWTSQFFPCKRKMQRCDFKFLKLTQKSLDPSNSTYPALFFVQNVGVPVLQLKLVGVRKHRWMGTCCGVASVMDIKNDVQLQASFQHYEKNHQPGFPWKLVEFPLQTTCVFLKRWVHPTSLAIHQMTLGPGFLCEIFGL